MGVGWGQPGNPKVQVELQLYWYHDAGASNSQPTLHSAEGVKSYWSSLRRRLRRSEATWTSTTRTSPPRCFQPVGLGNSSPGHPGLLPSFKQLQLRNWRAEHRRVLPVLLCAPFQRTGQRGTRPSGTPLHGTSTTGRMIAIPCTRYSLGSSSIAEA